MDDGGTIPLTVEEGSPITIAMIEQAVRNALAAKYGNDIDVTVLTGSPVGSAEATTYNYKVIVYTD